MNERKYLPDIPLLAEERKAAEESGKPKLPGAPSYAHESALLAIEEGLPLLYEVGEDLKTYGKITQSEKRKGFKYTKIHSFLNDPKKFEDYIDTLRILSESWEGMEDKIQSYLKEILDDLEKFIDVGTLKPEAFQGWISLMVKSEIYKPIVERIIRTVLSKVKTPQALISFLYNLAEALLTTNDKEVLEKGLEILTLGAPFLNEVSERCIIDYMKAMFTTNDDELLRRAIEIETAIHYLGQEYASSFFEAMQYRMTALIDLQEYQNFLRASVKRDPEKIRALNRFYNKGKSHGTTLQEVTVEMLQKWPYNLISKDGKVRELFNERVAEGNEDLVTLSLPLRGQVLHSLDSVALDIVEVLNKPSEGNNELKDSKYLKTLFYLTPPISKQKKEELSNDVVLLRQEIYRDKNHGISPRGDRMLITDPEITILGIKSFTFKVEEHAPAITVSVEVGNYRFVLTIDQNFEMKDARGNNLPLSFEQRAFMEHLVLSYLKELMCAIERVKSSNGEKNGNKQIEREQEFMDRRPHLRKMAPHNAFSQEALAQGLMDPFRYDLVRINAELGLTKETGQQTYVKASHKALPGEEPLISRAPHATDRLKRILAETVAELAEKDETGV